MSQAESQQDNILDNPLIAPSTLPYGAIPFSKIKSAHYLPAMQYAVARFEETLEAIKANPDVPTFENTVEALEFAIAKPKSIGSIFSNISWAASDDITRAVEDEMAALTASLSSKIFLDPVLFKRLEEIYKGRDSLNLDAHQKFLLESTYETFIDEGAAIPDANVRDMLRDINKRLSELGAKFNTNVIDAQNSFNRVIENEEELVGIPERIRESMAAGAEEGGHKGKWLIGLSDSGEVLTYSQNAALREELYRASYNGGFHDDFDNTGNILEQVRLRREKANLLGYQTYSDMALKDTMAGSADGVMAFLNGNQSKYMPAAQKDLQDVRDIAQRLDGISDIKPWDFAYYSQKLSEERLQFDPEEAKQYFELNDVLKGMYRHFEKLFGLEIVDASGKYDVYHPDVLVHEVRDAASGEVLGIMYGDYQARPGTKLDAGWATALREAGQAAPGVHEIALAANVCNFEKKLPGQPALLSLDDVRTAFHEFGHGMHAILTKSKYKTTGGMNVKVDFVEFLSQIQENWARQEEVLTTFAKHHKTGETIPHDMVQKLLAAEQFQAGYAQQRFTFQGLLDMKWHTTDPAAITSVEALEDEVVKTSSLFPRLAGPRSVSFDHIFVGDEYASTYYQYQWTAVSDADAFEPFKGDLYNADKAKKLKEAYEMGNLRDPMEWFVSFRGHKPDTSAILRRDGLAPGNDNNASAQQRPTLNT